MPSPYVRPNIYRFSVDPGGVEGFTYPLGNPSFPLLLLLVMGRKSPGTGQQRDANKTQSHGNGTNGIPGDYLSSTS